MYCVCRIDANECDGTETLNVFVAAKKKQTNINIRIYIKMTKN